MPMDRYLTMFATAGIALVLLGTVVMVLEAFKDASTSGSIAEKVINQSLQLFTGLTSQFSTVGSIAGILFLLVILGLVGFWGYTKIRGRV